MKLNQEPNTDFNFNMGKIIRKINIFLSTKYNGNFLDINYSVRLIFSDRYTIHKNIKQFLYKW